MILYLTIAIIIWLALTCVYFICESQRLTQENEELWHSGLTWQLFAQETDKQLQKWKRPRAKNGRFR